MPGDALLLFVTAIVQEDVALLAAAYFIVERGMPPALAAASVYGGTLLGNLAIYSLGATAHQRRWRIGERVARVRARLRRHWARTLLVCRLIPGLLWPTLLGCGWLGISLARFALVNALAAAIYVAVALTLLVMLGDMLVRPMADSEYRPVRPLSVTSAAIDAPRRAHCPA